MERVVSGNRAEILTLAEACGSQVATYPLSRLEETLSRNSRTEHRIIGVSADSYRVWVAWATET